MSRELDIIGIRRINKEQRQKQISRLHVDCSKTILELCDEVDRLRLQVAQWKTAARGRERLYTDLIEGTNLKDCPGCFRTKEGLVCKYRENCGICNHSHTDCEGCIGLI